MTRFIRREINHDHTGVFHRIIGVNVSDGGERTIEFITEKLCKIIRRNNFTHLIGHSMGGGLLMKYISDFPKKIPTY
jgi:pimeloyl-ACP methyl ester carboxylesterase